MIKNHKYFAHAAVVHVSGHVFIISMEYLFFSEFWRYPRWVREAAPDLTLGVALGTQRPHHLQRTHCNKPMASWLLEPGFQQVVPVIFIDKSDPQHVPKTSSPSHISPAGPANLHIISVYILYTCCFCKVHECRPPSTKVTSSLIRWTWTTHSWSYSIIPWIKSTFEHCHRHNRHVIPCLSRSLTSRMRCRAFAMTSKPRRPLCPSLLGPRKSLVPLASST